MIILCAPTAEAAAALPSARCSCCAPLGAVAVSDFTWRCALQAEGDLSKGHWRVGQRRGVFWAALCQNPSARAFRLMLAFASVGTWHSLPLPGQKPMGASQAARHPGAAPRGSAGPRSRSISRCSDRTQRVGSPGSARVSRGIGTGTVTRGDPSPFGRGGEGSAPCRHRGGLGSCFPAEQPAVGGILVCSETRCASPL